MQNIKKERRGEKKEKRERKNRKLGPLIQCKNGTEGETLSVCGHLHNWYH